MTATSNAVFAEATTRLTCDQVLQKCDLAVHACEADRKAKQSIIDNQQLLLDQKDVLINQSQAWYHNPGYVVPITVLLTLFAVRQVTK